MISLQRRLRRRLHVAMAAGMAPAIVVRPIPLFADNYCWWVRNEAHACSLLIDPADPPAVLAAMAADPAAPEVVAVLYTHHHWDHAGKAADLAAALPAVPLYIGAADADKVAATLPPGRLVPLADGAELTLGHMRVRALHTPCHTRGHTCYLVGGDSDAARPPALFTGDTLFAGGCGRFFEGTAADMAPSLDKLAALPDPATLVFCGHEYTESNLTFCAHVEPGNAETRAQLARAVEMQAATPPIPTVPSTLARELATNVFMRVRHPDVIAFARARGAADDSPVAVLAAVREAKNGFRAT